ncbi:MAG TPA: YncE family protein [Gemmatimonadaceae bacterium]|nr:YncE family protein [Gemmatimonadaceae bacterium]
MSGSDKQIPRGARDDSKSARDLLFRLPLAMLVGCCAANMANAQTSQTASPPTKDYLVFVGSEGNDKLALLRFGPKGASIDHEFHMGTNPTELVGPHGVAVSPDGRYYYVTTAHGMPHGSLWKYSTVGDSLLGRVELGNFPATVQVAPNGAYIFVANFNLHGDMVPSSVSVVYGEAMVEIVRVPTCVMPHGSRLNAQGTKHYSVCMMNDALIEIDASTFKVARHFMLTKGSEHGATGPIESAKPGEPMAHDMSGHGMAAPKAGDVSCSPTWAQPSADGSTVYVACNKSSDIAEVDVASWTLVRRIPTGDGVYNLAATHDGRLLIGTNRRGQSASIIDIKTGKELSRIPTTRKVASGVAVSSDDRYAFVTVEGVGSQPGTVDIIDLISFQKVASVDVGQQAGGIDFWKAVAPR